MEKDFLNHIYDSYTRADSKRVQKAEGAGLGMAITKFKHIVDKSQKVFSGQSNLSKTILNLFLVIIAAVFRMVFAYDTSFRRTE